MGKLKNNTENNKKPEITDKATEKTDPAFAVFTASDITFRAINVSDDTESSTSQAENTDKFTCSFTVKNFNSQLSNAEIFIVILQPDGRVLKTSGWDSGTFNTTEGRKVYSYKFSFKYNKGEAKRLLCSLKTENLQAGNYSMEVYYNGQVISKTIKPLL